MPNDQNEEKLPRFFGSAGMYAATGFVPVKSWKTILQDKITELNSLLDTDEFSKKEAFAFLLKAIRELLDFTKE